MLTLDSAFKFVAKDYKETLMFCVIASLAIFIPFVGILLLMIILNSIRIVLLAIFIPFAEILLLMGLSIRIISNSINQNDEIPKVFGNFRQDIINGLKYFIFIIILMIPFIAIIAGSFGGMINAAMSQDISGFANVALGMESLWLLPIIILAYAIVVPGLTANYAKEQKFSAFFDINKAFRIVFGNFTAYLKMIGFNVLYSIALSAIAGVLSFTIIGPIILSPLTILVSGKILGDWFSEVSK
jgi:hypothetical protein